MVKFYETLDSEGRVCIRLNRRNGRILARWRNDMPNQTRYQFVRERNQPTIRGTMNENEIAKMLRDNLERLPFNVNDIPAWVIDKACGKNAGFCIVSMQDGYIGIEHETDKAYLLYVENTFNTPKCAGWEFWVAKSLLK